MYKIVTIIIITLNAVLLTANTASFTALNSGYGARPLSLGNTFTAIAEGSASAIYNPAGFIKKGAQIENDYLDLKKIKYDKFEGYSIYASPFNYLHIHQKKDHDSTDMHIISYARKGNNNIHWGISHKTISQIKNNTQTNGFSIDLGVLYNINPNITLGMTGKDIYKHNLTQASYIVSGVSLHNTQKTLRLASDIHLKKTNKLEHTFTSYGIEGRLSKGLWLRAGYNPNFYATGVKIEFPIVTISYGILTYIEANNTQHILKLTIGRGLTKEKTTQPYRNPFKRH